MRYTTIIDIREFACYRNERCRLLYLHLALSADREGNYIASLRGLAMELGFTFSALRHALGELVADGLVTTQQATQQATQGATQRATQRATHLHVVTFNELRGVSDTTSDTRSDTTSDTTSDTSNDTLNKEYNNIIAQNNSLTPLAREEEAFLLEERIEAISKACALSEEDCLPFVVQFCAVCDATNTPHKDIDDAVAHCISWINKQPRRKRKASKKDAEIRAEKAEEAKNQESKAIDATRAKAEQFAKKIPEPKASTGYTSVTLCEAIIRKHEGQPLAPPALKILDDACKSIGMGLASMEAMLYGY